jgi:hypothetical protein
MAKYDPFAVRSVLGPDWIISHEGEDHAGDEEGGKHMYPSSQKDHDKRDEPTKRPERPKTVPPNPIPPTMPTPGTIQPFQPVHPVPYRTAYTTGPKLGVAAACFLGLAVFFVVLPSSTLTLSLGGFFFSIAFFFIMAIGCCCVPVNYNTTINNNGNTGNMPPYILPGPGVPVLPVFRA